MSEERITLEKEAKAYEADAKTFLKRKMPVFVQVNGKRFKTFTSGFDKPFDSIVHTAMQITMKSLCEEAQGCVFGWTNSDEITIVLTDYKNWNSVPWLDYDVAKICSVAASTATLAFSMAFAALVNAIPDENRKSKYEKALSTGAKFSATCFNVPEDRVNAMIFWRQNYCRRNTVQYLANTNFSRKEVIGKCNDELFDMLRGKGIVWDEIPMEYRNGASCIRRVDTSKGKLKWFIDRNLPRFSDENKNYIQNIMDSVRVEDDI